MNRRLWARMALSLPFLVLIGACTAQSDKPSGGLPTVRVGIGMGVDQLKAGSTYPFATAPSVELAGGLQAFQVTAPYNLVLVDGAAELKLDNLGGQWELTHITLKQGRVTDIAVTVQNGRANVHQVIEQAKGIYDWFASHGFEGDEHPSFVVVRRNGTKDPSPISSFEQAKAAFLDPDVKLAEMGMYGFKKGTVHAGVSLSNGRRKLARHGSEHDDELNAKEEKRYMLVLSLVDRGDSHKPTN